MDKIIWFNKAMTIADIEYLEKNNMAEHLGMRFTEIGNDFIKGTMPVDHRTRQPYGLLHGGASAALAETLGSLASAFVIDPDKYICVGIEINANHVRGVRSGSVTGTCTAIHIGATTHVWDIRIHDDANEKLVCISRLTVAILKNNNAVKSEA
ncbi:MAG TPA: hotdog fold thioesterase [Panacibacter sp.]|nr:hotdog fold thioesterase [Panacibacter sp.]